MDEKKILIFYIDVRIIELDKREKYISEISKKISPEVFDGEIIFLPIYGDSRVECINPVYITDNELIREHRLLMDELHEHIKYHIENEKEQTGTKKNERE